MTASMAARPVHPLDFDETAAAMLPLASMMRERDNLRSRYTAGMPFEHVAFEGMFDEWILDRIVSEFPAPNTRDWLSYDTINEVKQTSRGIAGLPPFTQLFFMQLCSQPFVEFVRYVTNIGNLVPDPLFHGGGLHESRRGGWLNIHADWTRHPALPLTRRINLIIYLNRGWQTAWNGGLELWDTTTKTCGARVEPLFNRAVIFPTTPETLHGFPTPLACPEDRSRRSVSVFYWSPDPEVVKEGGYITFLPGKKRTRLNAFFRSMMPPIAFAARNALKQALERAKPTGRQSEPPTGKI